MCQFELFDNNILKYQYLICRENNRKDIELSRNNIELTKLKYANIDKEIKLTKIQLELAKYK